MVLDVNFRRIDYHGEHGRVGLYPGVDAASKDLDALLKVETRKEAVKFLDAYSPLYRDFSAHFTHPSQMDEKQLNMMVGDVMNTVMMMRVVIDAYKLLREGVTADGLRRLGFKVDYRSEDEAPRTLTNGENWFDNCVMCGYAFEFDGAAGHAFAGEKMPTFDANGEMMPLWVIEAQAQDPGQTPETYAQALTNCLDYVVSHMLSGVRVVSNKLRFDFAAHDYSAFMWYEFFNRLTCGEIRTCQACGKPFVANLGASNERGGEENKKRNCSATCRTIASRARTAIRHMKRGMTLAEAAKTANVKFERLERFIELNPDEMRD